MNRISLNQDRHHGFQNSSEKPPFSLGFVQVSFGKKSRSREVKKSKVKGRVCKWWGISQCHVERVCEPGGRADRPGGDWPARSPTARFAPTKNKENTASLLWVAGLSCQHSLKSQFLLVRLSWRAAELVRRWGQGSLQPSQDSPALTVPPAMRQLGGNTRVWTSGQVEGCP